MAVTDSKGVDLEAGQQVLLADARLGVVRGVHEGGCTVWLEPDKKDEGLVATVESKDVTVQVPA